MAVFTEQIEIKDGVSAPVEKAAKTVNVLATSLDSVNKSLARAQALGDIKAVGKLTKQSEALTAALPQARAELSALTASETGAGSGAAGMFAELSAATGGLIDIAAAALAAVGAFAAVTIAGAAFAIKASEAKNASLSLWDALGEGKITGQEVDDMLDDLRSSTGLTKDSLAPLTEAFLKMGINGKEALEGLTVAAASAEALVKGGGDAFATMYRNIDAAAESGQKLTIPLKKLTGQLAGMGLNVADVGTAMGITGAELTSQLKNGTVDAKKFGDALQDAVTKKGVGPMQNLANSSANLGKLLQEYIGDMFEDLGPAIAPFMAAVKDLFSIFDSKAQPSGEALKAGIGGFFKEVFKDATIAVPYIKHFLLDVVIFGLKAYIALKPFIDQFKDLATQQSTIDTLSSALEAVGIVLLVVGAAVAVAVAAFVYLADIVIEGVAAFIQLEEAIFDFMSSAGAALTGWVTGATSAASDFVAGLVQGITDGSSQVVASVTGLADSATGAFKSALGIASPSKVMMELGGHTGTGFAMGLDDTGPDVHGAATGLAGAATQGAGASPAGTPGGKGNSNIYNVTVSLTADSKSAEGITREMVAATFEAFALGAGV